MKNIRIKMARNPFVLNIRKVIRSRGRRGNIAEFHTGRCGSTVLANLLCQNPDIEWAGEIFEINKKELRKWRNWAHSEPLNYLKYRMFELCRPFWGFETKTFKHLDKVICMNLQDYIHILFNMGFTHFIILKRRNSLRRLLSFLTGRESGNWQLKKNKEQSHVKVHIDIHRVEFATDLYRSLLEYLALYDEHYEEIENSLKGRDVLQLFYEDDILNNPVCAYKKVCHFLNIKANPVQVDLRRINIHKTSDCIINFKEVEATLNGTKYQWMLSD